MTHKNRSPRKVLKNDEKSEISFIFLFIFGEKYPLLLRYFVFFGDYFQIQWMKQFRMQQQQSMPRLTLST